jgi:DNA-binding SARP family transcriptional activator
MAVSDERGRSLLPRGRKTRAVIALLALAAPRPVLRDQLAGLLWSQRGREQARASLRQALHELHRCLGPLAAEVLRNERTLLRLNAALISTDVQELSRVTAGDPDSLDVVDGPLLDDLTGLDPALDRWLAEERRAIMRRIVALAEALLASQQDPVAITAAAERLLAIERTHEGAWRALMQVHLARDERASALQVYERCAAALAETSGMAPSAETQALVARIRGRAAVRSLALTATRADPQRIRLGVMPFRSIDGSGAEELSIGLAEEITTALSRFRGISLISSTSLANLAGESLTESPRWQTLDVDSVLDGTVQRNGQRVRIMVRLLDVRDGGEVIWARRFDRAAGDILAMQDEIAAETAAQIDPELLLREGRRAASNPPRDPKAYDLLLRAIPAVYRIEEAGFRAAGETLAAAAALDPDYAQVHAWWAYWHVLMVGQGWAESPASAMQSAGRFAERAVTLDPSDARAVSIAGHVRAFLNRDPAAAIQLHQQALSLNPCLPMAWVFSGMAHAYAGNHSEAIQRIGHARRLSPFDPHSFFFDMALMIPHFARGEYEMVVELGRRATALNPRLSSTQKGYLAALGHLGRTEEQTIVRERLLRLEPGFCVRDALTRSPLLREEDRARYAEGLRRAGLAEQPP